jgi:hypothetical protein
MGWYGMVPTYIIVGNKNILKIKTLNQGKNIENLALQ